MRLTAALLGGKGGHAHWLPEHVGFWDRCKETGFRLKKQNGVRCSLSWAWTVALITSWAPAWPGRDESTGETSRCRAHRGLRLQVAGGQPPTSRLPHRNACFTRLRPLECCNAVQCSAVRLTGPGWLPLSCPKSSAHTESSTWRPELGGPSRKELPAHDSMDRSGSAPHTLRDRADAR